MKLKQWLGIFGITFFLINGITYFHAYKFTHFTENNVSKTKDPKKLSATEKIKTLLFGINNPKPINKRFPSQSFETVKLKCDNQTIEGWFIQTNSPKGSVILFHGYSGNKSSLIEYSDLFLKLGFNTLLIDFRGSGGSTGNQTTIGFKESEEVKTYFNYLQNKGEKNIYLFGKSMGGVAIMKAVHDYSLKPNGIILESPFGSAYQSACQRFKLMKLPDFPMAGLLVFWIGLQNGFWAFSHNPTEYAKTIYCPTLLLYGGKDDKVTRNEIETIYKNLRGKKELRFYPLAKHESYFIQYPKEYLNDLRFFIKLHD
jgi:hypothetical protein